jgi:tetratricopeptide (TPR) repeat protein
MNFQRGNYSTALRILELVRRKHEELGDPRRVGLCDLDRAEIYLQLNLFDDAGALARKAFQTFRQLGGQYEAAKSLTFKGIVEFKLMNDAAAEKSFVEGREMFMKEGNDMWVAIVDLWRAQLLVRRSEFRSAQQLAFQSAETFGMQHAPALAANAWVLSAQCRQALHDTGSALSEAQKALGLVSGFHAPWVAYQCYNALGRLKEADGAHQEAEEMYLKAVSQVESLRGNITLDEMRMSFGKDKYQVYENIVTLKLNKGDEHEAFEYVERSKSRTLTDLLERNLETVWETGVEQSPRLQRIRTIREELNVFYNRLNQAGATARPTSADSATKEEIDRREHELVELLRQAGSERPGWTTLKTMPAPGVSVIQGMLDDDEVLVEYYMVGDRFCAFVIGRDSFSVVRNLGTSDDVWAALRGFNFQLSKFHLQPAYLQMRAGQLLEAAQFHLRELYRQLIEPLTSRIDKRVLIIVPHQRLHYVPFHALYDGEKYIVDSHEVVYAASASVLKICRDRPVQKADEDLVLGVPDEWTPHIHEEIDALRGLLPKARVFVGSEAREDKLREFGPGAGKLHIAAHGVFRPDNPMFSSLRLGDSWLNLFDIFNLQLGAELTTLSACETGMSAVWEGDELLGLARGFLYAGTPSLVVSLWTVNDRSTAQLMERLYRGLQQDLSKATALREAIVEVKERFPHPYYWAPFVLMGKS